MLNNKVALVTGASRGIGAACAKYLGAQGAVVVGTATTEQGANMISSAFEQLNIKGFGLVLNVCDESSIQQTFSDMAERCDAPTIVVNNAGITDDNLFPRMKPEQWHRVIDTDLSSLFRVCKAVLKPMLKQRWGRIINISSISGVMGNPGQTNYAAAKAGMIGFTKSLALEVAGRGITVNAIAPGFIDTDMTRGLTDKQQEAIIHQIPMRRIGKVDDIAYAVNFLASEQAAYITGQTIQVNGGMCMI